MHDTELLWLNVANVTLGVAVVTILLAVLFGTVQEFMRRHKSRLRRLSFKHGPMAM